MKTRLNINQKIRATELRVLDAAGENLGVIDREKALALAEKAGLDLIEIAPTAKPPVARIMSFDKFRYEEEKRQKEQKSAQKNLDIKQVQIHVREAVNDLKMKAKRVNGFLAKGHNVSIVMVLRGREKRNKDWAKQKLEEFLETQVDEHQRLENPKLGGRGITIQITPKK